MRQNKMLSLITLACALAMPLSGISPVMAIDNSTPAASAVAETPTTDAASDTPAQPAETPSAEPALPDQGEPATPAEAETPAVTDPAAPAEAPTVAEAPAAKPEAPGAETAPKDNDKTLPGKATGTTLFGTVDEPGDPVGTATIHEGERLLLRFVLDIKGADADWAHLQASFSIPANYQFDGTESSLTVRINGQSVTEHPSGQTLENINLGKHYTKGITKFTVDIPVIATATAANQKAATAEFKVKSRTLTLALPMPTPQKDKLTLTAPDFNFGETSVKAISLGNVLLARGDAPSSTLTIENSRENGRLTASMSSFALGDGYRPGNVSLAFTIGGREVTLTDNDTATDVIAGNSGDYQLTNSKLMINQFDTPDAGMKTATITWTLARAM